MNAEGRLDVLPVCQALVGRYPFSDGAQADAALKEFELFFRPNGLMDGFFSRHLNDFVDRSSSGPWRWKTSAPATDEALLEPFKHGHEIKRAFFDTSGSLRVSFGMKPVDLSKRLREFHLFINGEVLTDRHTKPIVTQVVWPGKLGTGSVRAVFVDRTEDRATREDHQEPSGPWAWFRYLDKVEREGRLDVDRTGSLEIRFEIEEGKHSDWQLLPEGDLNPFNLPALTGFHCVAGF
jgi:type VI secretion system protein ImpL